MSTHRYNTRFQAKKIVQSTPTVQTKPTVSSTPTIQNNLYSNSTLLKDTKNNSVMLLLAEASKKLHTASENTGRKRIEAAIDLYEFLIRYQFLWISYPKFRSAIELKNTDLLAIQIPNEIRKCHQSKDNAQVYEKLLYSLEETIEDLQSIMQNTPMKE